MLTVTITNLTNSSLPLDEIYANLGAAGSAEEAITITRTAAQLDQMDALKELLDAGSVSVSITKAATDIDFLTANVDQHGSVSGLAVDAAAVVTSAVTFPKAFAAAPKVTLTVVQDPATDFKANVYARAVTAAGFTIALDVTTAGAASGTCSVNWTATY